MLLQTLFGFLLDRHLNVVKLAGFSLMIGYFLKWFGLSVVEVTDSRLRQLRMNYDKIDTTASILNLGDSTVTVQWHVIKYEDWSNGLINPIKRDIPTLKKGESIRFGEKLEGIELLTR